jgi:hypothetical protein
MSRELKFRVFDNSNKKMNPVNSIWGFPNVENLTIPFEDTVETLFNNFELMQFIGLKDKLGNDIYEGDILEFPFEMGIAYVINDGFRFAVKSPGSEAVDYEGEAVLKCTRVIGNIYENPDLLQ